MFTKKPHPDPLRPRPDGGDCYHDLRRKRLPRTKASKLDKKGRSGEADTASDATGGGLALRGPPVV
jgi:hypothetical protein